MGITNPIHLAFIAIVALIVLGPKRLPDLARSLGEGMRQFRESLENASHSEPEEVLGAGMVQPESPVAPLTESGFPASSRSPVGTVSPPSAEAVPAEEPSIPGARAGYQGAETSPVPDPLVAGAESAASAPAPSPAGSKPAGSAEAPSA
jgi:TatA/E family protein of Tat protein translocase